MQKDQQAYFEDMAVGDETPPLVRGPLTEPVLMRWSAAIENWHRIHYDRSFAVEHDKLPDLLINGTLKQQLIVQAIRDWAGLEGWLWKISFQFRAMNKVGETLTVWGKVTGRRELQDYGLVDLDVGVLNGEGKESTPGKATVALPYRSGRGAGVPYPFVPPDLAE